MSGVLAKAQLEPEDVIQETYAACWANLANAEFDGFDSFLAWLRQIAENKLVDIQRAILADKRDVRRQVSGWGVQSGSYVNLLDAVTSPLSTPSRGAARSEGLAVLMVRLQQLPEDYRQVIVWRLIEGTARRRGRRPPEPQRGGHPHALQPCPQATPRTHGCLVQLPESGIGTQAIGHHS